MSNVCKDFFVQACKAAGVTQKNMIKLVWGKCGPQEYWYDEKSDTIRAHCIWCARAEAAMRKLLRN